MSKKQPADPLGEAYYEICRDNSYRTSMDAVTHIVWLLLLRYADEQERVLSCEGNGAGRPPPALVDPPYRWRDWVPRALGKAGAGAGEGLGPPWSDAELMAFVRRELLPTLAGRGGTAARDLLARVVVRNDVVCESPAQLRKVLSIIDGINWTSERELSALTASYGALLGRLGFENKSQDVYPTPLPVARFMVEVVAPRCGEHVYDPSCGLGTFLIETHAFTRQRVGSSGLPETHCRCAYSGREKKAVPAFLGLLDMLLHGMGDSQVLCRNALEEDVCGPPAERYDVIFANPPSGGSEHEDIQRRFPIKTGARELLYLQHIMAKLKEGAGARCALVVPEGLLFSRGVYSSVKQSLLSQFCLFLVVSLPPGTFAPWSEVKTDILFFERPGPTTEVAYAEVPLPPNLERLGKKNPIRDEHFAGVREAWKLLRSSREGRAAARPQASPAMWYVPVQELAGRMYDLSPKRPAESARGEKPDALALIDRLLENSAVIEASLLRLHRLALRGPFGSKPAGLGEAGPVEGEGALTQGQRGGGADTLPAEGEPAPRPDPPAEAVPVRGQLTVDQIPASGAAQLTLPFGSEREERVWQPGEVFEAGIAGPARRRARRGRSRSVRSG